MMKQTAAKGHNSNRIWRVRLFEGPVLETLAGEVIRRFRSQKIGALLAYLALRLGHSCPREEIMLALWPDGDDERTVANRLRVALASLRRQMEPAGVLFGSVLDVSLTGYICLRAETVWCDVVAFDQAFKARQYAVAAQMLTGTLLPGYYDDWAILERERLETLRERLLQEPLLKQIDPEPSPTMPLLPPLQREETASPLYPLPLYLTHFFGREKEQQQLSELLCEKRLLTITGSGGIGKTRLAVETAQRQKIPTVFVALADVMEGIHIPGSILRAMGVLPSVEVDLIAQLIAVFQRREAALLILDNAEHLLAPIAEVALRLLEAIPDLAVLVTSRQYLNIAGETVLSLAPLETPSPQTPYGRLARNPAVALFLDRARNARPDFALTLRHAEALVRLCRLLEGVPLALELAAARIVMQTPLQIADAMASGLLHLKSQQHGFSARHRSLRASIQGSYDLLSPEIQTFFARLSLFQGGWSLEAARQVTECAEAEEFLEDLGRRSLLVIAEEENSGVMRFAFLESIRQFAAEQLTEAERRALLLRHADYFLTLAAQVTEDDIESLLPLDAEQENLLMALETGSEQQIALFSAGLIGALYYAYIRGHNRRFLSWTERSMTLRPHLSDLRERIRLGIVQYLILGYVGRYDLVHAIGEEMQSDAVLHQSLAGSALAKLILSYLAFHEADNATVLRLSREALLEARQANEETLLYRVLRLTAWYWLEVAIAMPEEEAIESRALLLQCEGLLHECLSILPPRSSQIAFAQSTQSHIQFRLGNPAAGYSCLKAAQKTALAHGMQVMLIFCIQNECLLAAQNACYDEAALLYGAFRSLREKTGYITLELNPRVHTAYTTLLNQFGEETFEALAQRGEQIPLETLIARALPLTLAPSPEKSPAPEKSR